MPQEFTLKKEQAETRLLKDLEEVVFDKDWFKKAKPDKILYWMWRGLKEINGITYDILRFAEGSLGRECLKTLGHGHSLVPKTSLTYPELYQVLEGEVIYLLQKRLPDKESPEKVLAINCRAGDFCLVPPNFEHVTINLAGSKTLMANWVTNSNRSDYSYIKKQKGAGYFALYYSPVLWVKNDSYKNLPKLEEKPPTNFKALDLDINQDFCYNENNKNVLNFLKEPQNYPDLWASF